MFEEFWPTLWGRNVPATKGSHPRVMSLWDEMNRLFGDFAKDFPLSAQLESQGIRAPRITVKDEEKAYAVEAEMPGLTEKDIEVQFADGGLTIKGEKSEEKKEEKDKVVYQERSHQTFLRRIPIQAALDEGKIAATFQNGVLSVTLPKTAEAEKAVKKIEVKGK